MSLQGSHSTSIIDSMLENQNETIIKDELSILREKFESQQMMLEMTNAYMQSIQKELEDSKRQLEETNKHMVDSITYAERIQKSLLTSNEYISKLFPDCFVLHRAKDILSGDFFWFHQENQLTYVAAIDCTGHGVPGAMLTVLVNSLLVQIVKEKKYTSPKEILLNLDKLVDHHLSDATHQTKIRDGLDIALCVFDMEKDQITFAGAHQPLYIIRDEELIVHKGARYSLGDNSEYRNKLKEEVIPVQSNDAIYLFSDGYADQFGGEKKSKFMRKNFKALLFKHHKKPMREQKELMLRDFLAWKGDLKQTDDILVIGINY